jgi:hypothetical protein
MGGGGGSTDVPETAAERALAEVSAKEWQDYQENFVPLENQYMERVNEYGDIQKQQQIGNQAASQVMTGLSGANNQMQQQQFSQGLDPTSGGFKTKSLALNKAIQKTKANAQAQGQFAGENAYIQGLGNIVAMGNNQQTTAMGSMGDLARQSTTNAINDSRNDFIKWQGDQELKGAVVGGLARGGMAYASAPASNPFEGSTLNIPAQGYQNPVENPFPSAPNSYNPLGR